MGANYEARIVRFSPVLLLQLTYVHIVFITAVKYHVPSSLHVRDQSTPQYKTTRKRAVLYVFNTLRIYTKLF
jgi:hypothetical protein